MSAEAAQSPPWAAPPPPELDAHGFATARSARYADSHEQALAQCVEDVMAQLEHKGCAGAENIVSVLWVSENKQVLRAGPAVRGARAVRRWERADARETRRSCRCRATGAPAG